MKRWLECYWTRRLDGVPLPLDEAETRRMIAWLPALRSLFPAAVAQLPRRTLAAHDALAHLARPPPGTP